MNELAHQSRYNTTCLICFPARLQTNTDLISYCHVQDAHYLGEISIGSNKQKFKVSSRPCHDTKPLTCVRFCRIRLAPGVSSLRGSTIVSVQVLFDTGSATTWVPSSSCELGACVTGHKRRFHSNESTTYVKV